MAFSATSEPMLISERSVVTHRDTSTARSGMFWPRVDVRQPFTEGQAVISGKRPDLTTGSGHFTDHAVCQPEDDEEHHHVDCVLVLHRVHEDLQEGVAVEFVAGSHHCFDVADAEDQCHRHEEAESVFEADCAED